MIYPRRLPGALVFGAGGVVACLGLFALMAWPGGPTASVFHPIPSTPPVALCLVLAGGALLLLAPAQPAPARRWAGLVLSAITAGIGLILLTGGLVEGGAHRLETSALGFIGVAVEPRSTTSLATALTIALAGTALLALGRENPPADAKTPRPARTAAANLLAGAAATIALVTLIANVFAQTYRDRPTPTPLIPPYLALALLTLSTGILLARPGHGPMAALTGTGPGAAAGRRLAPALIFFPLAAALASVIAVYAGIRRPSIAITACVVLAALGLLTVVSRLVRKLDDADRTQRSLLAAVRERQTFADTLLQSINEGVLVLNAEHRVVEVNPRWCQLAGRSRTDAIGRLPPYPWDLPAVEVSSGEPGLTDLLRRPDGQLVPVLASMAAIPDEHGEPQAFVATYVDISDRKRATDELAEHAAVIEAANAQLHEANDRLERAIGFKTDLMSVVTHELSQPISSIASLAELLTADWVGMSDDLRLELSTRIDKNTRRLIRMMNDLMLLFGLDAGQVIARRMPVPVLDVVETAISNLPQPAPPISLAIDPALTTLADRGHFWQVMTNLLSNAVRHGKPPIEVTARLDGDWVTISVRDSGPGVPPAAVQTLFNRFMKGSGLGLFIVQHLVEANGGTVSYQAAEPTGALLMVRLEAVRTPGTTGNELAASASTAPIRDRWSMRER